MNGVEYVWDANGNLLNDGVNLYDYNSANRLTTLTSPSAVVQYSYNGLGDRLQETVNSETTTFTMDLNSGLTQALSDGTYTYLYGNGRIAQVDTTAEYYLNDALGSVRQMTDATGAITYARSYDPYGVVVQTSGASQSAYGYTNEYTSQGLIYLRSRWYDPASGRFPTKDSWQGDYNRPLSLNRWNYVEGNPVNRIDPSGRCWYPDLKTGDIKIDIYDPSPGICTWFVNAFQQQGIAIPANSTPNNWVNNLPLEVRQKIAPYLSCSASATYLSHGHDNWMVIIFSTMSKWQYYETTNTEAELRLVLGIGGGGSLSCDNTMSFPHGCTLGGSVDLGEGGSIMGFKLEWSLGVTGEWNIAEGTVALGAHANFPGGTIFVSITKISISLTNPITLQSFEKGFQRDAPESYWVLVRSSTVSRFGYKEFARTFLPFRRKPDNIHYQIVELNESRDTLLFKYLHPGLIVFN